MLVERFSPFHRYLDVAVEFDVEVVDFCTHLATSSSFHTQRIAIDEI